MKRACIKKWKSSHWKRGSRYYHLIIHQDLWGEWLFTRSWGGQGSNAKLKSKPVDYKEALTLFKKYEDIRQKRKYDRLTEYYSKN